MFSASPDVVLTVTLRGRCADNAVRSADGRPPDARRNKLSQPRSSVKPGSAPQCLGLPYRNTPMEKLTNPTPPLPSDRPAPAASTTPPTETPSLTPRKRRGGVGRVIKWLVLIVLVLVI